MRSCISGWVMDHRQPAIVEDIFSDPRIPLQAYEPTFVRSVTIVPIRSMEPIGAIGTYWSVKRLPQPWEVRLLQALADTTAVAMENVRVHAELERRVSERTADLEAFSFAVSHDLRGPLRHVRAYSAILLEDHGDAMDEGMRYNAQRILNATNRMGEMVDGLLQLHITARAPLERVPLDLAELARDVALQFSTPPSSRHVDFITPRSLPASGDPALLRIVLQNLLGNAWKFTGNVASPRVELGMELGDNGEPRYFVRDNGAGFSEESLHRLFGVFQRLHRADEFPGTGIGLATVARIVRKHEGRAWAQGREGEGATFYFTLGNEG
jgi:light-regulated signal transduction histidine kinase (bacteriophytochrome)